MNKKVEYRMEDWVGRPKIEFWCNEKWKPSWLWGSVQKGSGIICHEFATVNEFKLHCI